MIFEYSAYEYSTILNLILVCKKFQFIINSSYDIWQASMGGVPKEML